MIKSSANLFAVFSLSLFAFAPLVHGEDVVKQDIASGNWRLAVTPDEFGDAPSIMLSTISEGGALAVVCRDNMYEFRFVNGEKWSDNTIPMFSVKFKLGTKITETFMTATQGGNSTLMITGSIGEIKPDPVNPNATPYIASQDVLQGIESNDGAISIKINDYSAKFGKGAKKLFPKFRLACEAATKN